MLLRRSKYRIHGEERPLALTLATTAGVLNAMAFGAFGFFPSHMTGNTFQLSAERVRSTHVTGTLTDAGLLAQGVGEPPRPRTS